MFYSNPYVEPYVQLLSFLRNIDIDLDEEIELSTVYNFGVTNAVVEDDTALYETGLERC